MITARSDRLEAETRQGDLAESEYERWHRWPIHWTAVWVGALAALSVALIFGLCGIAMGAHLLGPESRVVDLRKLGFGALVLSVCGSFFSFVVAGWVSGKIAGILRAEEAMLHGAIAWLVAVPMLTLLGGFGAGSFFGTWFSGLAGTPVWATPATAPFERPDPPAAAASITEQQNYRAELAEYHHKLATWKEETPRVARNSALGAVTALLLGLVGSVLGGWMASKEPMSLTYHRTRYAAARPVT